MRCIYLALTIPLITSCATIKPYPVCFYDDSPPSAQIKKEHASNLLSVMRRYDAESQSSIDGRWIFANTSHAQHNALTETWPRIACIGNVTSGTEVKRSSDCVNYLHDFLVRQSYLEFDIKEPVAFSDEAPGKPNVICHRAP